MSTPWNDSVFKMDGSLVVMIVVVLVLMYQVFMIDRFDINYLKIAHSKEGKEGMEGISNGLMMDIGRSRARSGMLSTSQGPGGGLVYGSGNINDNFTSSFLGGGEPPVFYDIGNLRGMKANADATGYTYTSRKDRMALQQIPVVTPAVSSADKVAAAIEGLWVSADQDSAMQAY
jgi:hypothetical protein